LNNLRPCARINAIRDLHSEPEEILHRFTQLGVATRLRIGTVRGGEAHQNKAKKKRGSVLGECQ